MTKTIYKKRNDVSFAGGHEENDLPSKERHCGQVMTKTRIEEAGFLEYTCEKCGYKMISSGKAIKKVNAIWVPLRKRLLELVGNKEGFVAVLGTDNLFEIVPDGFEYPTMMVAVQASQACDEFRKGLRQLAEQGEWERVKHAILSIPEVQ